MKHGIKDFFKTLNPSTLFFCAVLCLPGILFQRSLAYLWADIALFIALNLLKKGGIRILPPLILCISVVFFNLFTPEGLVLFSLGKFKVTLGAVQNGLHKSGVLLAMVFVSQYAVSRDLNLPGKAGGFLSRVFYYFDALSEKAPQQPLHEDGDSDGEQTDAGQASAERSAAAKKRAAVKAKSFFSFFIRLKTSASSLIDKTDERLLQVFLSSPDATEAAAPYAKVPAQKKGSFMHSFARALVSALPLFPVYLLWLFALAGFYPV